VNILVVDDERPARERLRNLIAELGLGEVVGEAATGREALELTARLDPDVLLLDIRMPGMDGLETAAHLAKLERPPAVIFTTAYGDYALRAFETQAVDYLLKPIRLDRLERALHGARRLNRAQLGAVEEAGREPDHPGGGARTHLSARVHGDIRLIPIEEVIYFQADQKYVTVRDSTGQVLIEEALKSLEEEFAERFVRIHRNALVARRALEGLERAGNGRYQVRLEGIEERLEVSRRHLSGVRRLMRG